jgi:hypothetical protein
MTFVPAMIAFGRLVVAQLAPVMVAPPPAPVEPPAVEWKAQAKGGVIFTAGNSQTTNGTLSLIASRKQGGNKVTIDGNVAYGTSNVLTPVFGDATMPMAITSLERRSIESTNLWNTKARYDRFFTPNNTAFLGALAGGNRIAGKSFTGGFQVGYSRQVYKSDMHLFVAEIGYDFSHERYITQPGRVADPVTIHSARAFVGETLKLTPETGLTASLEALFNLNQEGSAINVNTMMPGVGAFKDTRVNGKVGFSTTVRKSLSVALGLTVKYDQNPAPRPVPSGSPAGAAYADTFRPFADKTDVLSEATLIYTFL